MSILHTTPNKKGDIVRTSTPHSHDSLPPRKQDVLKAGVRPENDSHMWGFPPDRFANMVTPSVYLDEDGDAELTALDKLITNAPPMQVKDAEPDNYEPLADFLNACVKCADKAIEESDIRKGGSLYPNLTFFDWGREMGDRVERSEPLKPDLIAVNSRDKPAKCFWSPPEGSKSPRVEFPVEVKSNWPVLVPQVGTYAHGLTMSSPLRAHSLVIGFNTKHAVKVNPGDSKGTKVGAIRFMLFHHGGISSSEDLDMAATSDGRIQVVRILARIMLWQTEMDAGIPAFTDGVTICLPKSLRPNDSVSLFVQRVLYHRLSLRGRNTYVARIGPIQPNNVDLQPMNQTQRDDQPPLRKKPRIATSQPATTESTASQGTCEEPLTALVVPRHFTNQKVEYTSSPKTVFAPGVTGLDDNTNLVVKCAWLTKDRAGIETAMYEACSGEFGCPAFGCSFPAHFPDGRLITNAPYLPDVADIESRFWKLGLAESQPDHVEERTLQVTVLLEEGQSLEGCEDSKDLVLSVGHALLGYLVALLKGYMHRDISIGNILRLFTEVERKSKFSAKSVVELVRASSNGTQAATDDVDTWDSITKLASGDAEKERLVDNAKALECALDTLKISNKCRAVWTDADMAANLNGYSERERNNSKVSGTKEFQSWGMRYANTKGKDYAHTPLDDLHSFFWTTLWATLNNKNQIQSDPVVDWQSDLRGTWQERGAVMKAYTNSTLDSSYGPMIINMQSFLEAWESKADKLIKEGHAKAAKLSQGAETTGDDILDMYKRLMFRGVQEYFDLILEHKESLGLSI